jgi:hypothetical protein
VLIGANKFSGISVNDVQLAKVCLNASYVTFLMVINKFSGIIFNDVQPSKVLLKLAHSSVTLLNIVSGISV